ncbi:hypothetical protein KKH23_08335, partial [Patescibacteria group bacterium]|nr:hypothetical protein [Patescibacteria group bacterium]
EVIRGSRTFIANFGLEGAEAANLISVAMQQTGSKMDDTLDSLDEYSQLLAGAGYTAEESIGIITTAIQSGARDTDKVFDAIKETQIRLLAGDYTKPFTDLSKAATESERAVIDSVQAMLDQAASGEISVNDVLNLSATEIKKAVDAGEISRALQDKLQVAITGTMAEDLGTELYAEIFSAPIDTNALIAQSEAAGDAVRAAISTVSITEQWQKEVEIFATTSLETIAPYMQGLASTIQTVSQVAPGLKLIADLAGPLKNVAVSLLTKLVPSLFTTTVATGGATTATYAFNAAWLASPITWIIAGIAGLAAGALLLADALTTSNEEKQEEIEADTKLVENQKKLLTAKQNEIDTDKKLAARYEELASVKNRTAEQDSELTKVTNELNSAYGGVIKSSDTYENNIKRLQKATTGATEESEKLSDELIELDKRAAKLGVQKLQLEFDIEEEEIADKIGDASRSWYEQIYDNYTSFGFATRITDFISGDFEKAFAESDVLAGKDIAGKYVDAIKNAKNDKELAQATADFQEAVFFDEKFEGVPDDVKNELLNDIEALREKQSSLLKAQTEKDNLALSLGMQRLEKQGKLTTEEISKLATEYGKTEEEARALLAEQKKQTAEANKTADAVASIGEQFKTSLNEAQEKFNKGKLEEYGLRLKIDETRAAGQDTTDLEKQLKAQQAQNRTLDTQIDKYDAIKKATDKFYDPKTTKKAVDQQALILKKAEEAAKQAQDRLQLESDIFVLQVQQEARQQGRNDNDTDRYLILQNQLKTIEAQEAAWEKVFREQGLLTDELLTK